MGKPPIPYENRKGKLEEKLDKENTITKFLLKRAWSAFSIKACKEKQMQHCELDMISSEQL